MSLPHRASEHEPRTFWRSRQRVTAPGLPMISTRPPCPLHARSDSKSKGLTVTHRQANTSLTCVNRTQTSLTRRV